MPYSQIRQLPKVINFGQSMTGESTGSHWDEFSQHIDRQYSNSFRPHKNQRRTAFNTVIDLLSTGTYASAGFTRGLVNDEFDAVEGMMQGIGAGLTGREDHRHTYSRVLEDMGWEPESTGGKIARGVVGLAGDIFLDPTTYLTGGMSALVKGTGKSTARVTHGMSRAMSVSDAKPIVQGYFRGKGIKTTAKELSMASEQLASSMNSMAGFSRKATPLRISFDGAPFGKKIFGKYSDVGFELVSAETMANIGDSTFAPIYRGVRDNFFGSRMGGLFSNKKLAYQLSKESPEKLMEVIAPTMRKSMLKMSARESFTEFARRAKELDIDEATAREVFDALEDPSIWTKARKMLTVRDIDESGEYIGRVRDRYETSKRKLKGLEDAYKEKKKMSSRIQQNVAEEKQNLDNLRTEMRRIQESGVSNRGEVRSLEHKIGETRRKLRSEQRKLNEQNESLREFYSRIEIKEQEQLLEPSLPDADKRRLRNLREEIERNEGIVQKVEMDETHAKRKFKNLRDNITDKYDRAKTTQIEQRNIRQQRENFNVSVDEHSSAPISRQRKDKLYGKIQHAKKDESGRHYITYATKRSAEATSEATGWPVGRTLDGEWRLTVPDDVAVSARTKTMVDAVDRAEVIGDIGRYTFDDPRVLSENMPDRLYDDLVEMIRNGENPEVVREFIERNPGAMKRSHHEMYRFMANELGYKDFHRDVKDRLGELRVMDGELSPSLQREMDRLEHIESKRAEMMRTFRAMDEDDMLNFISEYQAGRLSDSIDEFMTRPRGIDDVTEFQPDHRGDTVTNMGFDRSNSPYVPSQRETELKQKARLTREEVSELWSERGKRWSKTDNALEIGQRREASDLKRRVSKKIDDKKRISRKLDEDLAEEVRRLNTEKPDGYVVTKAKKRREVLDEKIRLQREVDDAIAQVDEYYEKAVRSLDYRLQRGAKSTGSMNTAESRLRREVSQSMDSRKDAIATDIYDEILREPPYQGIGEPGSMSEYDVAFIEDSFMNLKNSVLRGNNGDVIDIDNLTNDQYKSLIRRAINKTKETVESGHNLARSRDAGNIDSMIRGRKALREATEQAKKRTEKVSKKLPNLGERLKNASRIKEEATSEITRLNRQIEEIHALHHSDEVARIQRNIDDLKARIQRIDPHKKVHQENVGTLEDLLNRQTVQLEEAKEARRKISEVNRRLEQSKRNIDEFERTSRQLQESINMSEGNISELMTERDNLERVLDDDNLLTNYIYNLENRVLSEGEYADLIEKYSTFEYSLRTDVDISDRARNFAEMMKKDLYDMGMDEMRINKLTKMMEGYLPRVPTEAGRKFFNSKSEAVNHVKGFGDTFGFGRQFNPHGKSRTITALYDSKGNIIRENPSIREINEHFAREFPELKGQNVFSENLQELFLARAQKHTELMYDHQYMDELTRMFGTSYDTTRQISDTHMNTANIGRFREDINRYAKMERQIVIDDAVEKFIQNHKYKRATSKMNPDGSVHRSIQEYSVTEDVNRIVAEKSARYNQATGNYFSDQRWNVEFEKVFSRKIEAFKKQNFPSDARRQMVEDTMQEFLESTGTSGYLDDLSMPFLELNKQQSDGIIDGIRNLKDRRLKQIIGFSDELQYTDRATGEVIHRVPNRRLSKFIGDLSPEGLDGDLAERIARATPKELQAMMDDLVPKMSRMDYQKYKRYTNKLSALEDLQVDGIRTVPKGMTERFNTGRKLQIQRDNNKMLELWDKMTKFVKLNQTTVTPGFHGKNKMGNTFRNWLEVGEDAVDFNMQRKTLEVVRKKGKVDGGFDIVRPDGSVDYMSWEEAWNMADDLGVTSGGWFAFDGAPGADLPTKIGLKGKHNPFDLDNFFLYNKGARIGKQVEDQDRFLHFVSQMKRGMNPLESANSSQKFLFDYGDLTFFEQSVMKRIIPYYTWMRKNTPLQLEMMMENPKLYHRIAKIYRGVEGMSDEEDLMDNRFVNEFAQDWLQTPFTVTNRDGREENVLLNPNLPFMDLSNIPNVLKPEQSLKNMFSQMNPLITQPIEHAFNTNVFFDSPIVREGDNPIAQRIDHTLRQLVPYNVIKGAYDKQGADRALHAWNHTTGLRFLSYDYQMYRSMKLDEVSNMTNQEYFDRMVDRRMPFDPRQPLNTIVKGVSDEISDAMYGITDYVDSTKPTPAGMYDKALRPISQAKFDSLSEEEQRKYIPPDQETAWAYHKQAVEMEREAYEETRAPVRMIWGLFDAVGLRNENQGDYVIGKVTNVVDGDTFDIDVGGETKRIRPLLVDTPELDHAGGGDHEPFAEEATEFADDFLFDQDVRIIFDGNNEDMYGRTLGYVELPGEGVDYNRELLDRGYALTGYVFQPHYQRLTDYKRTELEAIRRGVNIHGQK